jgi:excisionase family DNA binding protein
LQRGLLGREGHYGPAGSVQLVRALVNEIIVDIDKAAQEIVQIIHWKGGRHSELRLRKPRTGEHGCCTSDDALAVVRQMAGHWSDQNIAATLKRMGLPTGQGKTWTAHRVRSIRGVRDIHAYKSAEKDGTWLTLREAAQRRGVTSHRIRKLIKAGILPAEQVVRGAPFQIRAVDLDTLLRDAPSEPAPPPSPPPHSAPAEAPLPPNAYRPPGQR